MAHPWGQHLSKEQVAQLWVEEGGPPEVAGVMAEIEYSEAAGWTKRVSRTGCSGLYQLCPAPPNWEDPRVNTRGAIQKYRSSGFQPWTCCNSTAVGIVNRYHRNPGKFAKFGLSDPRNSPFPNPADPLGPLGPSPFGGGDGGGPAGFVQAIQDIATTIGDIAKFFAEWARKIADPNTWLDAGKILLGVMLLWAGLKRTFVAA